MKILCSVVLVGPPIGIVILTCFREYWDFGEMAEINFLFLVFCVLLWNLVIFYEL